MPRFVTIVPCQQLHATNISTNIGEALEARVKDPLWFLARQWQTGEFQAKSGGRPVQIAIASRQFGFNSVKVGETKKSINRADPLEAIVEAEDDNGDAPAWRAAALEYEFDLKAPKHTFKATNYEGHGLDWSHFEYTGAASGRNPKLQFARMAPNQLYFQGAPHPRWWRLEEGHAYFDSPVDPEPNALSLLLPEYFYTDINNWYTAPIPVLSGSLLEVTKTRVIDSFGVCTTIKPVNKDNSDKNWAMYAIDSADGNGSQLNGAYLLCPNIAIDILHNDEIEEIRFMRDESANMVWAWERKFTDENGKTQIAKRETVGGPKDEDDPNDNLPRYVLKSPTARHWIPYIPQFINKESATNGEVRLRRARTDEDATIANPQYRSKVVSESKHLLEEEIPATGLRVRRIVRYARGSDGRQHNWQGRLKETAQRTTKPGLKFDYIK